MRTIEDPNSMRNRLDAGLGLLPPYVRVRIISRKFHPTRIFRAIDDDNDDDNE